MIEFLPIDAVKPYEQNPRDNSEAVPKVAESIRQFGFLVPIVVDADGVILAGHTRYQAAKFLHLNEIPVIRADSLTPAQAKAFRLADNKTAEYSRWDTALLSVELDELSAFNVDMADFGFDTSELWHRRQAWAKAEKFCNLKRKIRQHIHGDISYTAFFETGKSGESIAKIKERQENAVTFADCLVDYVTKTLGSNLAAGGWAIVTAPRRRHRDGFHFSTAICESAAAQLQIPFYPDAITAKDRNRIEPDFSLEVNPREVNVIFFDDIYTTGQTLKFARQVLLDAGHVVLCIAGIKN